MNYEELTEEQKAIWDAAYDAGHNEGWEAGFEEAETQSDSEADYNYELGRADGLRQGIDAEQARIQSVLGMMFESALNMGQGNKAVQYKHAMDLLKPLELKYTQDEDF
jgi:hypothetical protein